MKPNLIESHVAARSGAAAVLKRTEYAVLIASGLAKVTCSRVFANDEARHIEATMTFPVPFDAVVTGLRAKVDGRLLEGKVAAKAAARDGYEDALDAGKGAILHEELLRGIHMVSVANLRPGARVEIETTFVMPLSLAGSGGSVRIPLTVGEVYGRSPLEESDDFAADGPAGTASVTVSGAAGATVGGRPAEGAIQVPLGGHLVVAVPAPTLHPLTEKAADGRSVVLSFSQVSRVRSVPEADILLDASTSMSGEKWKAALRGVAAASRDFDGAVRVWTFSSGCRLQASTSAAGLPAALERVVFDGGGTHIGSAVKTVTDRNPESDVLLVTDGLSHDPVDISAAAASGARVTVVLVGHAALEANVGHLAAATGGQVFVADADVAGTVTAAVASMRSAATPGHALPAVPAEVSRAMGGLAVEAKWGEGAEENGDAALFEGAAAFAAWLAVPSMRAEAARSMAQAEGIVCHLTSILLVDEEGSLSEGLPANRKVPLAAPLGTGMLYASALTPMTACLSDPTRMSLSAAPASRAWNSAPNLRGSSWRDPFVPGFDPFEMPMVGGMFLPAKAMPRPHIDWDAHLEALENGDLSSLPADLALWIASRMTDGVRALARSIGISDALAAIALEARKDASRSRTARRLSSRLLASADPSLLAAA